MLHFLCPQCLVRMVKHYEHANYFWCPACLIAWEITNLNDKHDRHFSADDDELAIVQADTFLEELINEQRRDKGVSK